jgi:hypothetical protein
MGEAPERRNSAALQGVQATGLEERVGMVNYKRLERLPLADIDPAIDEEMHPNAGGGSWEDEVLRRIAPLLAEVRRRAAQDDALLGWEAAGVRRLAQQTGGEL